MALLDVRDLQMYYDTTAGTIQAVDGVSFHVERNQALGLVGESGCGKSSIARSILRLLPENGHLVGGSVTFGGQDLLTLPEDQMRNVRWTEISIIFQSAMNALNPVFQIGDQLVEALEAHEDVPREQAVQRATELLKLVGIPHDRMASYPHEMSGGMRQRAIIAMSLICRPKLIIADEPTTALDVVMQAQILREIKSLQQQLGLSLILITHDIFVMSQVCDVMAVMYGGKIVEYGPVESVFANPSHPYTAALLQACPTVHGPKRALVTLPGSPPTLVNPSHGCRFAPRCPYRQDVCETPVPTINVDANHSSACHFADRLDLNDPAFPAAEHTRKQTITAESIVQVDGIRKLFPVRRSLVTSLFGGEHEFVHAVDRVSFDIHEGEILGLVGESGCGKTTTGMVLSLLEQPSEGHLLFDGTEASTLKGRDLTSFRRQVQPIFQDPYESINPRFRVYDVVAEPLIIHGICDSDRDCHSRVFEMLELVGLKPAEDVAFKYPHQLSGGQRQRVAIARAMILRPKLIIADEPVSMLDASARSGIMKLMLELRDKLGVSFLLITHDLATARYMCDRIAIMYLGRIVEIGPTNDVITHPQHPYTKILLAAVPDHPLMEGDSSVPIAGEPPNPIHIPSGCRFHTRCPLMERPLCTQDVPLLHNHNTKHYVACHLAE